MLEFLDCGVGVTRQRMSFSTVVWLAQVIFSDWWLLVPHTGDRCAEKSQRPQYSRIIYSKVNDEANVNGSDYRFRIGRRFDDQRRYLLATTYPMPSVEFSWVGEDRNPWDKSWSRRRWRARRHDS